MRTSNFLLSAVLALGLLGCGNAIPKEKAAYVGHWQGKGLDLDIAATGKVVYKREPSDSKNPTEADLKGFTGNNMEIGSGPITTTFVVSLPPHQVDGAWKMTVDGIELTKAP